MRQVFTPTTDVTNKQLLSKSDDWLVYVCMTTGHRRTTLFLTWQKSVVKLRPIISLIFFLSFFLTVVAEGWRYFSGGGEVCHRLNYVLKIVVIFRIYFAILTRLLTAFFLFIVFVTIFHIKLITLGNANFIESNSFR